MKINKENLKFKLTKQIRTKCKNKNEGNFNKKLFFYEV